MDNLNFNFNPENFGLGVLAGWATAYGLYRARHVLGAARDTVSQQVTGAQEYATRSADSRYIGELIKYCEKTHLAGKSVPLSNIVVEPRFVTRPEFARPADEDVVHSVFHVVSTVYDQPYLHAPYNIETLGIEDLGVGDRAIALLGEVGSGRTTALLTIALWSIGQIRFDPPPDRVQEQLEQEEGELTNEQRATRIKERAQIEERARDSLEKNAKSDVEISQKGSPDLFKYLTPIYVHLANVHPTSGEYGRTVDPAEPLVRAVQHQVNRITARTIPRNIYQRLNDGDALLLLDGFDELPPHEQEQMLIWLEALITTYDRNFFVVTGSINGFGKLTHAGLAPVFLRPWHDLDYAKCAGTWSQNWAQISGNRRAAALEEATIAEALTDARALTPFEFTLSTWGTFGGLEENSFEAQLRLVMEQHLPKDQPMGVVLPRLIRAATLQLDNGYITAEQLEAMEFGEAPPPIAEPVAASDETETSTAEDFSEFEDDDDIDSLFEDEADVSEAAIIDEVAPEKSTPARSSKDEKAEKQERAKAVRALQQFLDDGVKSGLFAKYRGDRYQFSHALFAIYCGSLLIPELDEAEQFEKIQSAQWRLAVALSTMQHAQEHLVQAYLDSPPDILHDNVLELARWMRFAGPQAEWKRTILRKLGNMFVSPNQFPTVRERIAGALVGTRDKNSQVIFKKALNHPNPDVRRLACLGLGAMHDESAINTLVALLDDPVNDVQLAAGIAMGAIGTEQAFEEMVIAFTTGSDRLRQAIAEAFAAIPEEGYPILYDAIRHDDMKLRRAAVFGLRRINTPWALIALYRVSIEDSQWYVRTAAEQAFYDMRVNETAGGVRSYPDVESIEWLREWILSKGEAAVEDDQSADDILLMALQENDPIIQELAITNIGQLGLLNFTDMLYLALRHREVRIRQAAYRALSNFQLQMGQPLPSPA